MIDNVLTHPSARIVCVDTWEDDTIYETCKNNVMCRSGFCMLKIRSFEWLCRRAGARCDAAETRDLYDFAYIDGSHETTDVIKDAVLTLDLVKPGGIIAFDDYVWSPGHADGGVHAPKLAIDAFGAIFREQLEILHIGIQAWFRKREVAK
jgi:predicted O-methyltransferase YrrM